ncbi:J domain-containing protein [Dickeya fangzhongdai]|nr:J domain-containing protein [Dickeya fangzhongdai]MBO8134571.1 J domain-containing protein [Dickeya fangzhongdai]
MDNLCWQLLGIEPTQDMDAIRQAYRQTLPQFHPETDPEGFKRLRQAYDAACRLAQHPGEP